MRCPLRPHLFPLRPLVGRALRASRLTPPLLVGRALRASRPTPSAFGESAECLMPRCTAPFLRACPRPARADRPRSQPRLAPPVSHPPRRPKSDLRSPPKKRWKHAARSESSPHQRTGQKKKAARRPPSVRMSRAITCAACDAGPSPERRGPAGSSSPAPEPGAVGLRRG